MATMAEVEGHGPGGPLQAEDIDVLGRSSGHRDLLTVAGQEINEVVMFIVFVSIVVAVLLGFLVAALRRVSDKKAPFRPARPPACCYCGL